MGTDNDRNREAVSRPAAGAGVRYAVPAVEARAARAIAEGRELLAQGAAPITVAMHLRDAYVDMVMIEAALAVATSAEQDRVWAEAHAPTKAGILRVVDAGRGLGQVRRVPVTSAGRSFTPLPKDHPVRLAGRRTR